MSFNMQKGKQLSSRIHDLSPSLIREILSVANKQGMISFAAGMPSVESFPQFTLEGMPQNVLQYGPSEGDWELRELVADKLNSEGLLCDPDQVLILSGSQQGIDLVSKLFIDAGTPVAVEAPTYLAALQAFRFFGAKLIPYDVDDVEQVFIQKDKPVLLYAIPTFQNPSGRCLTVEQRKKLAAFCDETGLVLFEDDPYRDLVYHQCDRTPVCAYMKSGPWIYQGSFSKNMAPGLRLGFMVSSKEFLPHLTRIKQAADLHSNRVGQWLVLQMLKRPDYKKQMDMLSEFYRVKRDSFDAALKKWFSDIATWEAPSGGLFFWLTLKSKIDTRTLLQDALAAGVAYMPGEPFMPDDSKPCGQLRLNFSHSTSEQANEGLERLASLIRKKIQTENDK